MFIGCVSANGGRGAAKLVAEGLKANGMTLVDAPVSGGIRGAVNGTLAVMVSCPEATYDRVQPILKNFGKLFYTGDKPGVAQTAKLANISDPFGIGFITWSMAKQAELLECVHR